METTIIFYTSKGNEFVTYEDPRSLYPNAAYGIYEGNHGDRENMIAQILKEDKENQAKKKVAGKNEESEKSDKLVDSDKLVKVEEKKKTHNVVRILKHGDHYHIYTSDGDEYISYTNPSSLYPDIPIGTYVGSHGDEKENKDKDKKDKDIGENKEEDKKKENNKEDNNKKPDKKEEKPTKPIEDRKTRIKNLKITNILGKEKVDRYDIVKILKHGDHYHIYDSEGREGVTYENPQDIYPNANFGQYEGSHLDEGKNKDEINWPEGVTKIVSHGDHWHLYKGDEEIGVVTENPKAHYPDAEYIDESKDYSNVEVGDNDLFTYDSVEAKKIKGIERVFDDRFKQMDKFGKISDGKPAFGPGGQYKGGQVFYWLHGDHYHYLSIEDLLKMEKAGELGDFTAKDIVATLKYKMENPEEKIGQDYDDEKSEILRYNIERMLKKEYPDANVQNIGLNFYIYGPSEFTFHISDFEDLDGKIVYKKGKLPKMKKEETSEGNSDKKEAENPSNENAEEKKSENHAEEDLKAKEGEKDSKIKEEREEIGPEEKEENLKKAQEGYSTKEEAKKSAQKALESDFANDSYDIFQVANGRWFYTLKVS